MKKFLKIVGSIVLILIAFIAVLFIGFRIYISANLEDEILNDDSRLIPNVNINISKEENAWFVLKEAEKGMYYPEEKEELIKEMSSGEEWDEEFAKELTEKNKEAYKYLENSLSKKYFVNPSLMNLSLEKYNAELSLESINFIRKLSSVYLISIKNDLINGNTKGGISGISNNIELSNKICSNSIGTTLIEYLIGQVIAKNTFSLIESGNLIDNFNKEESILLQKKLETIENKNGLAGAFKFEYIVMKNEADRLSSMEYLKENMPELYDSSMSSRYPFYLKENKFKNMLIRKHERDVENSYRSCDNLIPFKKEVDLSKTSRLKLLFTENAIGKILIDITAVSLDSVQEKRCEEDFRVVALQIQLASGAYKKDKKVYPETLDVLKESDYLAVEIPEKINGWELNYDKNTGRLIFPEGMK